MDDADPNAHVSENEGGASGAPSSYEAGAADEMPAVDSLPVHRELDPPGDEFASPERRADPPLIHTMTAKTTDDGATETVSYTDRAGDDHEVTLPAGHPVLENFHRGIEAYWTDLMGAFREFEQRVGVAPLSPERW